MDKSQIMLLDNVKQELASIISLENTLKQMAENVKAQKLDVIEKLKSLALDKIELSVMELGKFSVTLTPEKESFVIDSQKLKASYNNIYQECVKVSTTKEHLTIRAKK